MQYKHSTNLYAWCNNNPVNRVDPSGLFSFGEWGRRVGSFVGGLFGRSDLGAAIGGYIGDRIDYAVGYAGISLGSNSGYNFSGYTAGNRARAKKAKPAPEKVLKSVATLSRNIQKQYEFFGNSCQVSRNIDGRFFYGEAERHYRHGNGMPVHVDASTINFGCINESDFNGGSDLTVNLFLRGNLDDAATYGKLDLVYLGNNKVRIKPNSYDFDLKSDDHFSVGNLARDAETLLGHAHAGFGTGFQIYFNGEASIGGSCSINDRL